MAPSKCRSCGGPHRQGSRRCLSRLTRVEVPTKEQLRTFRKAGEREFQALKQAKKAEIKATTAEKSSQNTINVQNSDLDNSSQEIQAPPVEVASGAAKHLGKASIEVVTPSLRN